jgi:hypothetical protein
MEIHDFRIELPHIEAGFVHLNHAGVSPVSTRVVDTIGRFLDQQSRDPSGTITKAWADDGVSTH